MHFPVCLLKDEILGYAIGEHYHPEVHISNMAVKPGNRRSGIGSKLVHSLIRWAESRSASELWLEVRESNIAAQAMYRNLGFTNSGCRKAYYKNPREDALLMNLVLDTRGD
jgi:ribosomal-protein-alanine N-acetyltransferase